MPQYLRKEKRKTQCQGDRPGDGREARDIGGGKWALVEWTGVGTMYT